MRLRLVPRTRGLSPSEAAAFWVVRHDQDEMTASEEAEFANWHADPVNAEAFARAGGAMAVFDLDDGSDPHLKAIRQAALDAAPAPRSRYRIAMASVAVAGVVGLLAFAGLEQPHGRLGRSVATLPAQAVHSGQLAQAGGVSPASPLEFGTRVGERRSVRLPDGTMVTLNTGSRMVVAFNKERRIVRLLHGQALFEVAHNRNWPFTVEAADRQVTALGTIFEVSVDPGRMHVVLVEGRVVVDRTREAANDSTAGRVTPAILRPGQELVAEMGMAQKVAAIDVSRQLLWRDGFVEFDDEPLGRAVDEINRYASRPIILDDDGVGALRLSGVFRTDSPDQFVNTIRELLPVSSRGTPTGQIELSLAEPSRR